MKTCEEYAALLDMYVDGFCTDEETAQVRAHLAVCEDCRMYVEQILQMKEAFPDAEETEVPEGFAEGVMAEIRAKAAPRKKTMKPWQKTLLQMAACIAVVIALGPLSDLLVGRGGDAAMETALDMNMSQTSYSTAASKAYDAADSVSVVSDSAEDAKAEASTAYDAESKTSGTSTSASGGAATPAMEPQKQAYARTAGVKLTEAQRQELLSGYEGEEKGDGVVAYVLTAAEFDAVLAKLPQDTFVPGGEPADAAEGDCLLTVYPAE